MRAEYGSTLSRQVPITLALAFAFGCSSAKTVQECANGGSVANNCVLAPPADTSGQTEDTAAETPDTGPETPDTGPVPDVQSLPDIPIVEDEGPIATEDDITPFDVSGKKDGQCDPSNAEDYPMNLGVGMPCTSHSQCSTCYCYDEAYLNWGQNPENGQPFRFCTQVCEQGAKSSCDELATGTTDDITCARFTQKQIIDYELNYDAVCVPTCQTVSDCQIFGEQYDQCGSFWEGKDISGGKHCQISGP